jgi:hypothetical protein
MRSMQCENHVEHTDTLCGKSEDLLIIKEVVHILTITLSKSKRKIHFGKIVGKTRVTYICFHQSRR